MRVCVCVCLCLSACLSFFLFLSPYLYNMRISHYSRPQLSRSFAINYTISPWTKTCRDFSRLCVCILNIFLVYAGISRIVLKWPNKKNVMHYHKFILSLLLHYLIYAKCSELQCLINYRVQTNWPLPIMALYNHGITMLLHRLKFCRWSLVPSIQMRNEIDFVVRYVNRKFSLKSLSLSLSFPTSITLYSILRKSYKSVVHLPIARALY